jgi:hypothetical protein
MGRVSGAVTIVKNASTWLWGDETSRAKRMWAARYTVAIMNRNGTMTFTSRTSRSPTSSMRGE